MWTNSKRLLGAETKSIFHSLSHRNSSYHTPSDINDILAENYSAISSNSNYDPSFCTNKVHQESIPVDFSFNLSTLPYNQPISKTEVRSAIRRYSKNTAPRSDQ